jgi:hypothetical protein
MNATDINNAGQIVGIGSVCEGLCQVPAESGFIRGNGWGSILWPEPAIEHTGVPVLCGGQDEFLSAITNSGYLVVDNFSKYELISPHTGTAACDLQILALYESGVALTPDGYVFDPLIDGERQWVISPTCPEGLCDEVHDKQMNASGQFILNVGNRAFLYTPFSEFPGGGSTEGCFPGPGAFPAPAPATLALIGIGLAGLAFSRRKRAA